MAGQQFNVQFRFTGDSSQLRSELANLKSSLEKLSSDKSMSLIGKMPTTDIIAATNAAGKLKVALDNATNVNTGKLDLSAFMGQLKSSKMTLEECRISLQSLGPEGSAAFAQLTNSILNAESSLFRSTTLVDKMKKSLGNVLSWNVSSTIFNTIAGQIKSAFGYARDLNRSLNDIQIVSGKNAHTMAMFAKEANQAAKALNTTTKEYAEASLIYFQQGLTDAQVAKRTDITIKMANVTGEAAADVSSYMTAIWNNFYDGSESLEHYADVITALGAATASSSEEIAGGLEKFAAIAETVGLSYEYATSALATVVSATRQSEETVGTAFKTIFGRMQSLNLGETLDDGTTLTKYSSALKTVGIEITNANGQLRDMDDVLDELGARWGQLDDASKVALANTLAGTRQYSNFMALMDNYDEFKINVDIAMAAEGTLEEQANIYGKSWEAATNRVKAAAETVYDSLVNSDQMIHLMDWFAGILKHVDNLVTGLGGLNGILSNLALWIYKIKKEKIQNFISSMGNGIANFFNPNRVAKFKADAAKQNLALYKNSVTGNGDNTDEIIKKYNTPNKSKILGPTRTRLDKTGRTELGKAADTQDMQTGYDRITVLQSKMIANAEVMTESQKAQAELLFNRQLELEKELKIKEDLVLTEQEAYNKAQEAAQRRMEELEIERRFNEEMAKAKQQAEDEYQNKRLEYERQYREYKKAQAYEEAVGENGLQKKASDLLDVQDLSKNTGDALSLTRRDLSNEGNRVALGNELTYVLNDDSSVVQEDTKKRIAELTQNADGSFIDFSQMDEEALEELQDILGYIQEDAKKIIKDTKNEIERMVAEAGGDATTATSGQTLRRLAGRAGEGAAEAAMGEVFKNGKPEAPAEMPTEPVKTEPVQVDRDKIAAEVRETGTENKQKKSAAQEKIKNTTALSKVTKVYAQDLKSCANEEGKLDKGSSKYKATVEKLQKAYAKYGKELKKLPDTAEEVEQMLQEVEEAARQATEEYLELADITENVDLDIEGAQSLGDIAADAELASDAAQEFGEGAAESLDGLTDSSITASGVITGLGETILTAASVVQSVKGLMEIYNDEDVGVVEKMIATVTTLMTILPALSSIFTIVRKAQDALVASQNKKIAADARDTASTNINTTSKWAQVQAILSNPYTAAFAVAAIVAAMALIAIATGKDTQANLDHAESLKEDSEAAQENLEARKELIDGLRDELNAVNETAEAYKNKATTLEDYYSKTRDAVKAFNEQIREENKLLGENEEKRQEIEFKSKDWFAIEQNQDTVQSQMASEYKRQLEKSVTEGKAELAKIVAAAGYSFDYDVALNDKDNNDVEEITQVLNADPTKYSKLSVDDSQFHVNVDETSSREDIIEAYEQVEALSKDLAAQGYGDTQTAEDLKNWLADNKEYYEDLINSAETYSAQGAELVYLNKTSLKTSDELENMDLSEYATLRQEMISTALDDYNVAEEDVVSYLEDSALSENEALYRHMMDIARATGQTVDEIIQHYEGLSSTERKAFSLIDVSDYADGELQDVKNLSERVQEYWKLYYEGLVGLAQDTANLTDRALEHYAQSLLDTEEPLDNFTLAQNKALSRTLEFQNAIESLASSWDDSFHTILTAPKNSKEYAAALDAIGTSLENALGVKVSDEWLSDQNNLILIQRLLSGDTGALSEIRSSISGDVLKQKGIDASLTKNIQTELDNLGNQKLKLGEEAVGVSFANLESAIASGQLTEEEVLNLLRSRGYEAETTKDVNGQIKITNVVKSIDENNINADLLDNEIDKTVQYDRAIERLNKDLEQIQKSKDKAFGANKIDLMAQERQTIDQLIEKYDDYKEALQGDLTNSQNELKDLLGEDETLQIDSNTGEILNRNELLTKYAGNEALIAALENYEEYLDEYNKLTEEAADLAEDKIASLWEEREYKIELRLELKEEALSHLEWELERIEGKSYRMGEALLNIEQQIATIAADSAAQINEAEAALNLIEQKGLTLEQVGSMTQEQLKNSGLTEQQIDQVKQLPNILRDNMSELYELRETYWEQINDAIEKLNEELDYTLGKFDNFATELSTYSNIIDLVGKKSLNISNDTLKMIREANQSNANNQLSAYQTQLNNLKEDLKTAKEQLNYAAEYQDEDTENKWAEEVRRLEEQITEANNNMLSSWENALQTAQDMFVQAVEGAIADMDRALSGGFGSIGYLQTAYEQQQTLSDQYIDDYKQVYELSRLTRNITASMNKTDSLKGKQNLSQILTRINQIQKDNTKLTEHDVELLQKQYDLQLAKMALEDAQNAKTQVRMRRDAEGNLSYVYTANQDNIDAAQQAYEDQLFAIQESNATYLQSIENQLLTSVSTYQSEVQSIMTDTSLNITEKQAKIETLQTNFQKQQTYYAQEFNKTIASNSQLYDTDLANYEGYAADKSKGLNDFITKFNQTTLGQLLTGYSSIQEYTEQTIASSETLTSTLTSALQNYQNTINLINSLAGISGEKGNQVEDYIRDQLDGDDGIIKKSAEALDDVKQLSDDLSSTYEDLSTKISSFNDEFLDLMDNVEDYSRAAIKEVQNLLKAMSNGVEIEGQGTLSFTTSFNSFDTGGYTGDWGADGRLALLHQKELVLNAHDTENMLSAINIVRELEDYVNANAKVKQLNLSSNQSNVTTAQTIEQEVTVHAEFPNAINHSEIEEAFENIVNMASQYAYRR